MGSFPGLNSGLLAPADSMIWQNVTPDWPTSRRDGSQIWIEGKHDRVWLNPFVQRQQFIQEI